MSSGSPGGANLHPPLAPAAKSSLDSDQGTQDAVLRPGHVKEVKIWNFMNESYGVYKLEPLVNMIIASDEEGVSTAVAALCLCLGGTAKLLKKKSPSLMIKSGQTRSTIQVTIVNLDLGNMVIERSFGVTQPISSWKVDGAPSDIGHVRRIVSELKIQLDNLCQFLPSARFSELASISPNMLLREVERAIGDGDLYKSHKKLIEFEETVDTLKTRIFESKTQIENSKFEIDRLERRVRKFNKFEEKRREIELLKKLIAFAKLEDFKHRSNLRKLAPGSLVRKLDEDSQKIEELLEQVQSRIFDQVMVREAENCLDFVSSAEVTSGEGEVFRKSTSEALQSSTSSSSEESDMAEKKLVEEALWLVSQADRLEQLFSILNTESEEYDPLVILDEITSLDLTAEEKVAVRDLAKTLKDQGKLTESYLTRKICILEEYLGKPTGVDENCISILEQKQATLVAAENKLYDLTSQLKEVEAQKSELFASWKQDLMESVRTLRKAFRETATKVASDGSVFLMESESIKDWKLEVLVKFGEKGQFRLLHLLESEKEKAISVTSFFVAIHGLTNSPIRVIDFFAQGMDGGRENYFANYLANTAFETISAQYFLFARGLGLNLDLYPKIHFHFP